MCLDAFVNLVWLFAHEPFHLLTYRHTFNRIQVSNASFTQSCLDIPAVKFWHD